MFRRKPQVWQYGVYGVSIYLYIPVSVSISPETYPLSSINKVGDDDCLSDGDYGFEREIEEEIVEKKKLNPTITGMSKFTCAECLY